MPMKTGINIVETLGRGVHILERRCSFAETKRTQRVDVHQQKQRLIPAAAALAGLYDSVYLCSDVRCVDGFSGL